jgi:TonB family protein
MFETSVVQARAKTADRRALLTVSLAAHAAVIAGIVALSVGTVTLPRNAPNQFYVPIIPTFPPLLGDGGLFKKPAATQPQQQVKRVATSPAVVAPTVVPNQVTPLPAAADVGPASDAPTGPATGNTTSGPGVPWGNEKGIDDDAPPTNVAPPKIYTVGDGIKPPVVIRRVTPLYPQVAVHMHLNGFAIVECIIDQSGRIRDAHVVKSSFGAFEQPALDAVQQWQFSPGTLNGRPVDVVFDLKVTFEVH